MLHFQTRLCLTRTSDLAVSGGRKAWRFILPLICALILALIECEGAAAKGEPSRVERIVLPDGGLSPQAAVDSRGHVHLIYVKGDPSHGDIVYERSDDEGKTFNPSIKVNRQPGSAMAIGTVRGPQLAIGKNCRVHVAWNGSASAEPKAPGNSTPMLYTRMSDSENTFEPQRNVISKYVGLDGGGSVAADGRGNVYVVWHAPRDGRGEASRWVWAARSSDDGKTFAPETPCNARPTGACGCCGAKAAAAPNGDLHLIYRTATNVINRDICLLVSRDPAGAFEQLSTDPWQLGKCAMSTSDIAESSDRTISAWETQGHIRFSILPTNAKDAPVESVPCRSDNQKHPSIAINGNGTFLIAWAENTGWAKGGSVAWQVFDLHGRTIEGESGRFDHLPAWSMPAAFARKDGTFVVIF